MKKMLCFSLCLLILLSCIFFNHPPVIAEGLETTVPQSSDPVAPPESSFTYKLVPENNPTHAMIVGYSGNETQIILPDTLGGYPVENVAPVAFSKNKTITYIKLPSQLKTITGNAFNCCYSLLELEIDDSNTTFKTIDGVLYKKNTDTQSEDYGKIESLILFPAGKGGAFTIPYGVKTIGSFAFDNCVNLTSVDMYNTVTTINANAFSYCWQLSSIRLSDNLKYLGSYALSHCDSLRYLDLPYSLNDIGEDALLGDIDSSDNKVYFFTQGVGCVKDSYAYEYIIDQHLPESIIVPKDRSITDNDTRIRVIDAYGVLPQNELLDVVITPVKVSEVERFFPTRCAKALAFDVSFTKNGMPYTPGGNLVINFDTVCDDAIKSATKVYKLKNSKLVLANRSIDAPFVGTQAAEGGRYVILMNNDFSLKGDVDGDGVVSLFDVRLALFYAANISTDLTQQQIATADMDNSTIITTVDVRIILRKAGGMEA